MGTTWVGPVLRAKCPQNKVSFSHQMLSRTRRGSAISTVLIRRVLTSSAAWAVSWWMVTTFYLLSFCHAEASLALPGAHGTGLSPLCVPGECPCAHPIMLRQNITWQQREHKQVSCLNSYVQRQHPRGPCESPGALCLHTWGWGERWSCASD